MADSWEARDAVGGSTHHTSTFLLRAQQQGDCTADTTRRPICDDRTCSEYSTKNRNGVRLILNEALSVVGARDKGRTGA